MMMMFVMTMRMMVEMLLLLLMVVVMVRMKTRMMFVLVMTMTVTVIVVVVVMTKAAVLLPVRPRHLLMRLVPFRSLPSIPCPGQGGGRARVVTDVGPARGRVCGGGARRPRCASQRPRGQALREPQRARPDRGLQAGWAFRLLLLLGKSMVREASRKTKRGLDEFGAEDRVWSHLVLGGWGGGWNCVACLATSRPCC